MMEKTKNYEQNAQIVFSPEILFCSKVDYSILTLLSEEEKITDH